MTHNGNEDLIGRTRNTPRFFVERRQIGWAALVATLAWGTFGFYAMPRRKDPEIPVRVGVATCQWPGATAQEVEQLITRPIEQCIAQNKTIHPVAPDAFGIRSVSLPGASFVYVQLTEDARNTGEQFNDINLKLQALGPQLPNGAAPVQFLSDFGDTAALMITVASPPMDELSIELRARSVEDALRSFRATRGRSKLEPVSVIYTFPLSISENAMTQAAEGLRSTASADGVIEHGRVITGRGFSGVDGVTKFHEEYLHKYLEQYSANTFPSSDAIPDMSPPVVIRELGETRRKIAAAPAFKYSYAELDDFTDFIGRALLGIPQTSRVERKGVLPQAVYLHYSQARLASHGLQVTDVSRLLFARNITLPGGTIDAGARKIQIDPSGHFEDAESMGNVILGQSADGAPLYLRDLVQISRSYQSPPNYLNFFSWTDSQHRFHRSRAITLAAYMRSGEQIQKFGAAVDQKTKEVRAALPPDLIVARTSDQPLQVKENIDLFMAALYEAVGLVVLIALIGFWEWRSALLMALSMPITLAMTFGIAQLVQIDLQQVSIATLIIALGLLVDDPVVANDAIKRELSAGVSRIHAAWLGPTKLAHAILYATATNIIAYLPFLLLTGNPGNFLYSLPVVMTAALVSSRLVSMAFIPLLGYVLLRPPKTAAPTIEERRSSGFSGFYFRLAGGAIRWRWAVLGLSLVFLVAGTLAASRLKTQFFPEDIQYWSYVDVWLHNDAPLSQTDITAQQVESVVRRVIGEYESRGRHSSLPLLRSMTTFVGGGGPRFWFSVAPEHQQQNYAQVLIQLTDKEATPRVIAELQSALSEEIAAAFVTVHQLQTNPVEFPVEVQISGTSDVDPKKEAADIENLRALAGTVQDILSSTPGVQVAQNDWFAESPEIKLKIDPDRANLAGITNRDVAASATLAMSGITVTTLREGNKQIPVIARLRAEERSQLSDVEDLYVYSTQGAPNVPLRSVSSIAKEMVTERIRRQEHFRTIGVHAYPQPGVLASEILKWAMPQLKTFEKNMIPGYRMQIGGEMAKQQSGFQQLAQILLISLVGIYAALLLQFGNAVKPLLVLAATPYGVVAALLCLALVGLPFGFMAFLGIASLIGVIVSHVIVLFDFIEEMREKGEPFDRAIRDAGIERLRPVMITVAATILALFPLAIHGGPLWQPLCYAQIGGLAVATFITLLLVPVLYSIAVIDLRIVKWESTQASLAKQI